MEDHAITNRLDSLLQTGVITPLTRFFARFVADRAGEPDDGLLAHSAALVSHADQQGDVCVELSQVAGSALFDSPAAPHAPPLTDWLTALRNTPVVAGPGGTAPLILDRERLYLGRTWRHENDLFEAIDKRLAIRDDIDEDQLAAGLRRLFPEGHPDAGVDWQMVACATACRRGFAVISGGPGTGKTTTLVKLLALLLEQRPDLRIRLAAPTGKAAVRMVESIRRHGRSLASAPEVLAALPQQATTLHRLLGYDGGRFRHGADDPLLIDCLVIDEASMVDLSLMSHLCRALPDTTRLILLGDRDQLASVEAGSVLGDITGRGRLLTFSAAQADWLARVCELPAERLPVAPETPPPADAIALLRTSYRFGADSPIGQAAEAVRRGDGARLIALLRELDDRLCWIDPGHAPPAPDLLGWAVDRYRGYLDSDTPEQALRRFEGCRVLCALHKGPDGVIEMNRRIEQRLRAAQLLSGPENCHGRPVMVTVNDYELELFNGDIGLLWRDRNGALQACFRNSESEELRTLPLHRLPAHQPAWAMSIHKSQGSEFDSVALALPDDGEHPVLTRELIYTGVTRARNELLIQGSAAVLLNGCRRRTARRSGLSARLGWPETATPPPGTPGAAPAENHSNAE